MLKIYIDHEKDEQHIEYEGDMLHLLSGLTYAVSNFYEQLCAEDPAAGRLFKDMFQACIADSESPVWGDGIISVDVRLPGMES